MSSIERPLFRFFPTKCANDLITAGKLRARTPKLRPTRRQKHLPAYLPGKNILFPIGRLKRILKREHYAELNTRRKKGEVANVAV